MPSPYAFQRVEWVAEVRRQHKFMLVEVHNGGASNTHTNVHLGTLGTVPSALEMQ